MDAIRASHPNWEVARIERDKDGRDNGYVVCASYWNEADATAECRLERLNTDESSYFVVVEQMVSVVYPADEEPPWVAYPERLKRRGYEVWRED